MAEFGLESVKTGAKGEVSFEDLVKILQATIKAYAIVE